VKLNGDIFEYAAFFFLKFYKNKKKSEYEERDRRIEERDKVRGKSTILNKS
jgi:hypothetical protein